MTRESTYQAAKTVAHKVEEIFQKHRDQAFHNGKDNSGYLFHNGLDNEGFLVKVYIY